MLISFINNIYKFILYIIDTPHNPICLNPFFIEYLILRKKYALFNAIGTINSKQLHNHLAFQKKVTHISEQRLHSAFSQTIQEHDASANS